MKTSELLNTPVDIRQLVKKLTFDEDALEEAAIENAKLLFEAGRYRLQTMRRKAKASLAYDKAYAEKRLMGRKKKDTEGRKVNTEPAVADLALSSDDVVELRNAMDESFALDELSKTLLECFRQRRDMIRGIIEIRASETSANLRSTRTAMQQDNFKQVADAARRRVSETEDDV